MKNNAPRYTNELINETSPYLRQHSHNPVNWLPWKESSLQRAKKENKLLLISIGYSACHWCHVMEHESFEDEQVAAIMNDNFICIKVDREERPDIDQVYMTAVQLMTGHGGWPLNCFALPDGRPLYGGTYYPKQQWINVLLNLTDIYRNEPSKAEEYASRLAEGMQTAELLEVKETGPLKTQTLKDSIDAWRSSFDNVFGGPAKAPKFPLPNNYQLLLRYSTFNNDTALTTHVQLTLKKMAYGGIFDQLGGGFARYSVDGQWKVPHFEKMLYDNAQLITLYSEAFTALKDPLYRDIVFMTAQFIERELSSPEGGFYSALDADSEGEEGKYYVWKKAELEDVLGQDYDLFAQYFNVNGRGSWEHGNNILLRHEDDETIAEKNNITVSALQEKIAAMRSQLLKIREKRIRPGLDDKILTSWNALMTSGYIAAYNAFARPEFLAAAKKNMEFLLQHCTSGDRLMHQPHHEGREDAQGFLEDYCFMIEALISLYQATCEEVYLTKAAAFTRTTITHFHDEKTGMFWFTANDSPPLVTRKTELSDNVIPASNSSMAKNLFLLGNFFEDPEYIDMSRRMLMQMTEQIVSYGPGYSNWAMLHQWFTSDFYEVAVVGKSVDEILSELRRHYLPNVIFAGSRTESSLPLLAQRYRDDDTWIYVCSNNACLQPVRKVSDALKLIKSR